MKMKFGVLAGAIVVRGKAGCVVISAAAAAVGAADYVRFGGGVTGQGGWSVIQSLATHRAIHRPARIGIASIDCPANPAPWRQGIGYTQAARGASGAIGQRHSKADLRSGADVGSVGRLGDGDRGAEDCLRGGG